jgi:heptosyltransferase-1
MEKRAPRILIVRLSAIGDVIQTMPVACALREHLPQAFVAWAVEERAAALLRGHQAVDELIRLPRGWLKSPRRVWQLRRRLRAMRFDAVLEAQGLTKAAIVAWLSGAPRRIGFGHPWGRELTQWLNNELVDTPGMHVVERNIQLLRPLGIASPRIRFLIPEHSADAAAADRVIGWSGLGGGFAIINPGAGWPSKVWPAERFAGVASHLGRRWSLSTLVVWAGAEEMQMGLLVAAGSGGYARIAPPTTLTELAALARRARLFVGSDTGPLHLAAAVGTPCVGLYGPWPAEMHGPYGSRHIALQKAVFQGSTRRRRRAPPQLMEAITVEDVCNACDRILQREASAVSFTQPTVGYAEA